MNDIKAPKLFPGFELRYGTIEITTLQASASESVFEPGISLIFVYRQICRRLIGTTGILYRIPRMLINIITIKELIPKKYEINIALNIASIPEKRRNLL